MGYEDVKSAIRYLKTQKTAYMTASVSRTDLFFFIRPSNAFRPESVKDHYLPYDGDAFR